MRDLLGNSVDEGIVFLVTALRLHGFRTEQSCEGHLDSGSGVPWVTFSANSLSITLLDGSTAKLSLVDRERLRLAGLIASCEAKRTDDAPRFAIAPFMGSLILMPVDAPQCSGPFESWYEVNPGDPALLLRWQEGANLLGALLLSEWNYEFFNQTPLRACS